MKLEDFTLDRLPVPDVTALSDAQRRAIHELWERLRTSRFPDLMTQLSKHHDSRKALDDALLVARYR